jgi:hypothetical protein
MEYDRSREKAQKARKGLVFAHFAIFGGKTL